MKEIHLWGVKQNNLKNIEVMIPVGSFTVICGPSGSGKSSLAFETLFAEGQRRFIESMSNYARQFLNKAPKPDIEGINNIPPAIAIEQKNSVKSSRSTVGTATEIVDYLRLLFEKIGQPHCPKHGLLAEKESVTTATEKTLSSFRGQRGYVLIEIRENDRIVQGKKLHSQLLQDGYLRIFVPAPLPNESTTSKATEEPSPGLVGNLMPGEFLEMSEPAVLKKGLPKKSFYLVIDRLVFSEEERGRLADSMTQAYEASVKYNGNTSVRKAVILTTEFQRLNVSEQASCPICDYSPPLISSKLFSFNSPVGACPVCKGFGNLLTLDRAKVIPDPKLTIDQGALQPFKMPSAETERKQLIAFCKKQRISLKTPWEELSSEQQDMIWQGGKGFFGVVGLFEYLDQLKYKMHVRVFISRYRSPSRCPNCEGHRLRPEVQFIKIAGHNINDLSTLTIEDLEKFFLKLKLSDFQMQVAGEVFKQIKTRLNFLMRVGVNYLSLNRETRTLSGGEYQRLALANQLGMGLSQTLYVLDEPTVGLHPRDNDRLLSILNDIKDLGNTLVIVEHDQDIIRGSENIIEMGPGSGSLGGEVIYSGPTEGIYSCIASNTAPYLRPIKGSRPRSVRPVQLEGYKYKIELKGAKGHNLANLDVVFPLNRLVVVTGVSGSGKSTLVTKTLYPCLARHLGVEFLPSQEYAGIEGVENIKNVLLIDQSPIGKSARSSPITYLKAFDAIRNIMAATPEAKARSYTPGTFSLNVDGGRCPACRGTGFEEIDMQFMDNVVIPCDVCDGKKFRDEVLEVQLHGKNISQILAMTVKEAMDFFVAHPNVRKPLSVLKEVGLDYIQIGQPANSLSGGESQRLKIAKEFSHIQQKNTLYILDEPTTGLHFKEVALLMKVLHKLIEAGGSVIIVEHNLDVISSADYVIDLGPDAGKYGGRLVACGSPSDIVKCKQSLTGQYLEKYMEQK